MPDYVYALHDFVPEHEDEVSFHIGERIEVVEKDDLYGDGWWRGRNLAGNVGLFPQSYTTAAPAPPPEATSTPLQTSVVTVNYSTDAVGLLHSPPSTCSASFLRTRLADIDRATAELQTRLAHLASARKSTVDALKSIVYPILRLPIDVTAEIFTHYVDWGEVGGTWFGRGKPHVLASVCKAWRDIALNLPKIWSRIEVANTPTVARAARAEQRIACWLQRAKGHDLDVDISALETPQATFSALAPYSTQWKSFDCRLARSMSFPVGGLLGRLPRLQSLVLRRTEEDPPATPIMAFSDAPLLREVYLEQVCASWAVLPWTQLTICSCYGLDALDVIELLSRMPRLESLSLTFIDSIDSRLPRYSVCLPRLRSLTIVKDGDVDFWVLRHMTVPALTHLDVEFSDLDIAPVLVDLLERSKCPLASLTLREAHPRAALEIVRTTPTLTELLILSFAGDWETAFFCGLGHDGMLPRLQKLRIEAPVVVPHSAILSFLRARAGDEAADTHFRELQLIAPARRTDELHLWKTDSSVENATHDLHRLAAERGYDIRIRGPQTSPIISKTMRGPELYTLNDESDGGRYFGF